MQGRTEEALEVYKQGIEHDPQCDLLYLNIGAVYGKLDKTKESLDYMNKGSDFDKNRF